MHPFLAGSDLSTLAHAFATYQLDYCNVFYVALPMKSVKKIQQVQNVTDC